MDRPAVMIEKCYAFTFAGGPGGHISVTDDGRAILVHCCNTDGQLECRIFVDSSEESAEMQARKHVLESIDAKAEFFEDPFFDLLGWLLQNPYIGIRAR